MLMNPDTCCVVMIDFQHRLMPAISQGDRVLAQGVRLARIANLLNVPVIGTEQTPDKLGSNAADIARLCHETLVKRHFNACQGGLLDLLPRERPNLVVAGCEAHVCMLQTALGLQAEGFNTLVVTDATGSRKDADRELALSRLRQQGAQLVSVEMVAFEWMESADHPRFREILKLIK
ncbi:isochorismatase family protein [Marinobacter sp.]|uniref:isochorismatase family protein n=1 Tax=Marinobacter sp. TaxID=50741 RepID=UPI0019B9584A|nr:isochorismatase family protein [Marinobacter sp.]MBD3655619.1 isochorismatase family protein [Marinobacter sp.]